MIKRYSFRKSLFLIFILSFLPLVASAQTPALNPGDVISGQNIEQYKAMFPDFFLEAFTTGWELIPPISVTVTAAIPNPTPKSYQDLSERNHGKYSLGADGHIVGGDDGRIVGFPFPDLKRDDPDFALKFMWNYDYRYTCDDQRYEFVNFSKRKGETASYERLAGYKVYFIGRLADDPKPIYETQNALRSVDLFKGIYPPSQRNFGNLLGRYLDPRKSDFTYMYLPSMRRVLRGEAGERSTPIMSSTNAPDDFAGFDGKTAEFKYSFVGEQKVLGIRHSKMTLDSLGDPDRISDIPVEKENWEPVDTYIFDITSKRESYPQSRKRIYVAKENYRILYAAAWDRAGSLWKVWLITQAPYALSNGEEATEQQTMLGLDIQLGYVCQTVFNFSDNGQKLTEADCTVSALRKMGR